MDVLKGQVVALENENEQLWNSVQSFNDNLVVLNTTVADTCSQVADNNSELQKLKSEVEQLKHRNIKLEAHTCQREHKDFQPSGNYKWNAKWYWFIQCLLIKWWLLKEDVDEMRLEQVYQIPPWRKPGHAKPWLVIMKLSFYQVWTHKTIKLHKLEYRYL